MNKIYKLKFDKRRNELVVVSEITAGMGKEKSTGYLADLSALSPFRKLLGRLTPVALLTGLISGLLPAMALAADLPTGGQIVGGQGSITTSGNQMTIHQQTHNMATDWHSFDVGKNNTVQFVQPDSSSVALNRVTGASGSQIMGTLKANGQVFILNPNGVLFGKDARVNVAGLVASTKNIDTADFMKGQYTFSGSGNPGSQVVNQGSLTTSKGGYIVLAGERVSNSGSITTPSGKTVLAAGKTVTLQLDNDGLTSVSVNGSVVNALVENRGLVSATNGQVYLTAKGQDMLLNTVVNNTGTLEAKGLESHGGKIVLNGGNSGVVNQAGQMLADSQAGRGGEITLEGQNIHLAAGSRTSATGKTGGGEVYVGGGWQGKDGRIRNASGVVMDKSAILDVSATGAGNGGTAVLWSDDYTNFRGGILARGGALSGDGGRVETSSHHNLQAYGSVDASAHSGHRGEWLLDPTNVTIVGSGTDTGVASVTADGTDIFTPSASGAQILNSSIVTQLAAGTNVTIKTSGMDFSGQSGDITVNAPVSVSTGDKTASLALQADNNIRFNPAGTVNVSGSSAVDLDLKAGKNIYLLSNISLNGGNLTIGGMTEQSPSPHVDSWNNGANSPVLNVGNFSAILSNGQSSVNGDFHFWSTKLNATHDINITVSSTPNTNAISLEGNWDITAGGDITLNGGRGSISLKTGHLSSSAGSIMLATDGTVTLSNSVKIQAQQDTNITGNSLAFDNSVQLNTTAGNVTLNLKPDSGGTVRWNGGSISAGNDVLISAASSNQWGPLNLTNPNISATKNITLTATPLTGSNSGSSLGIIGGNLTAGANLTLNGGQSNTGNINDGVSLSGTTLTAEAVNISGVTKNNNLAGVNLANVIMNAKDASVYGESQGRGTAVRMNNVTLNNTHTNISAHSLNGSQSGFNLSNITLGTNQTLANLNLSSAGSAQNAVNILDGSLFMNPAVVGQAVTVDEAKLGDLLKKNIENTTQIDMNGVDLFNSSDKGWVSNYRSAGGWAFKNTRVIAGGDVDLYNASFTDSTLNITNGNLNITNTGNVLLTGTDITANDGGVSIHSTEGSIGLNRGNISAKNDINLKTDNGSITITGANADSQAEILSSAGNIFIASSAMDSSSGLFVNNVSFSADDNITLDGNARLAGAKIRGANITANKGHININASALTGAFDFQNAENAGLILYGDLLFKAGTGTTINATHSAHTASYSPPTPLVLEGVNLTFDGGADINACGSYAGIVLSASKMWSESKSQVFVKNGDVNINATLDGQATGGPTGAMGSSASGAIVFNNGYKAVSFELDVDKGSSVTINADSSANKSGPFAAFAAATPESTAASSHHNGFVFSGGGNISVCGTSDSADAVNLRLFNNENLTGNLAITGISDSGVGVNFDKYLSTKVSNATITGNSFSGVGVQMTAKNGSADLDGNSVLGSTSTGKGGIILSGSNVTITNGTLAGDATNGHGNGISMVGGSNYILDGATISGHAIDGSGVGVNGTLTVNNGTQIVGKATGDGDGVVVSGNLTTTEGSGVSIDGTAFSGDGVVIAGDTGLVNATLKGQTNSGRGVKIAGNLKTDKTTHIHGQATGQGTGVILEGSLTGGGVRGVSEQGTGLQLANNAVVREASLKGESTSGDGVVVTGTVSLDDTTAATLNATSVSGSGLKLADNTSISIVNITTVTNPVTTAFVLTGTSQSGSGVATSGNVIIRGVVLNGSATTAEGTGASLGGNLTIADDISGITVNATGNGTALVVNNATIKAGGYTGTGKDFVINASTSNSDGIAIKIQGSNQFGNIVLNGTAGNGGTAVQLEGQVSGGHIRGMSDTGNAVEVQDGTHADGTYIKGYSDSGAGVSISGNSTATNSTIAGSTTDGTGVDISGNLINNNTTITGVANGAGNGAKLSGNLTGTHPGGTKVVGRSTKGSAVLITDGAQIDGVKVLGRSQDGPAIKTDGQVSVTDSQLIGNSVNSADLDVSGTLSYDQDTTIDAGIVTGQENIREVKPVPPLPVAEEGNTSKSEANSDRGRGHNESLSKQVEVNSAVNTQVTQMNRVSQDGFHPAGTPPVPVKGYRPAERMVDISLCDGNDCQSESLYVGKPAEIRARTSG